MGRNRLSGQTFSCVGMGTIGADRAFQVGEYRDSVQKELRVGQNQPKSDGSGGPKELNKVGESQNETETGRDWSFKRLALTEASDLPECRSND